MKTNGWLILGMMLATSAVAQNNNAPTAPPPPAGVAPAAPAEAAPATIAPQTDLAPAPAKPKKHKAAPPAKPITEPTVTLVAGPAEVAVNINARGQAGLKGELVAHLKKGDAVTVLDQINLSKHKAGEPAQWAKIALPSSTHAWINSKFVDATSKTVSVKKLNLRGGPGENYSVLGVIESGTPVKEIQTKGDWMEIEAPNNAYAFVAAMYLTQAASSSNGVATAAHGGHTTSQWSCRRRIALCRTKVLWGLLKVLLRPRLTNYTTPTPFKPLIISTRPRQTLT